MLGCCSLDCSLPYTSAENDALKAPTATQSDQALEPALARRPHNPSPISSNAITPIAASVTCGT